jgi:hypothetical protein
MVKGYTGVVVDSGDLTGEVCSPRLWNIGTIQRVLFAHSPV